jgi:hypothetical protein
MKRALKLIEEMEKNSKLIREEFESLREEYSNKFVAIEKGKVIDCDEELETLIERLKKEKKDLTLISIHFLPEKGIEIVY